MASKSFLVKTLAILAEVYNHTLSEPAVAIYITVLEDVPDEILNSALLYWTANSPWFPKPSELRRLSMDILYRNDSRPSASEAWQIVLQWASRYGLRRPPELDDKIIEEAARLTGWYDICMTQLDQLHYVRDRFENIYARLCEKQQYQQVTAIGMSQSRLLDDVVKRLNGGIER